MSPLISVLRNRTMRTERGVAFAETGVDKNCQCAETTAATVATDRSHVKNKEQRTFVRCSLAGTLPQVLRQLKWEPGPGTLPLWRLRRPWAECEPQRLRKSRSCGYRSDSP